MDAIIKEQGTGISRIQARSCIDMLASEEERGKISGKSKVYWLSPGWLIYWKKIFKQWDTAKANETFPYHDKTILLDSVSIFDEYSQNYPEKILEFSDWMKLQIEPQGISLERFKNLLLDSTREK